MPHQPYTNGKMARDVGVLCLLIASVLLTFAYRAQVKDMRSVIYKRCMERQTYDNASNGLRVEMSRQYRALAKEEQNDPATPDALRTARVRAWNSLADRADETVRAQVHTSCNAYR